MVGGPGGGGPGELQDRWAAGRDLLRAPGFLPSREPSASSPGRRAQEANEHQVTSFSLLASGFGFILNSGLQKMKPNV